jgi:hypothetical protein
MNEVYVLLVIFCSVIFGVPPLRWLYRTYVKHLVVVAGEKVDEYRKKLSERMSDAGRKVSAKMRT